VECMSLATLLLSTYKVLELENITTGQVHEKNNQVGLLRSPILINVVIHCRSFKTSWLFLKAYQNAVLFNKHNILYIEQPQWAIAHTPMSHYRWSESDSPIERNVESTLDLGLLDNGFLAFQNGHCTWHHCLQQIFAWLKTVKQIHGMSVRYISKLPFTFWS